MGTLLHLLSPTHALIYLTFTYMNAICPNTNIQAIDRNHYGFISLSELQESLEVAKVWRLLVWRHIPPSLIHFLYIYFPPSFSKFILFIYLSFFLFLCLFLLLFYYFTSYYVSSINLETVLDVHQYHFTITSNISYFSHLTALHFLASASSILRHRGFQCRFLRYVCGVQ